MKRYKPQNAWESYIKGWRESGKSQQEYCRMNDLNIWTFRNHLKKNSETGKKDFTEVHLKPQLTESIRIEVREKYTIVLPVTASEETLGQIIAAIEEAGCSSTGQK